MKQLLITLLVFNSFLLTAQFDFEKSVLLTASQNTSPHAITLHWDDDPNANSYTITRKSINQNIWFDNLGTLDGSANSFTDSTAQIGQAYEYRVIRQANGYTGFGYIYSGFEVEHSSDRGILLLVVDDSIADDLQTEIQRYISDARGDGWQVKDIYVDRNASSANIRAIIQSRYYEDPARTNCAFLLGHVPVPYSGQLAPDGHPDHIGAWSADAYYADLNGNWTDQTVNTTAASRPENDNIIGDGKWDQSSIPSPVELQIGRVDFAKLPAFADSEVELLRKYLNKNHAFRHKFFDVQRKGIVENNFSSFSEGFGQNGWKNFVPMFGRDMVTYQDYRSTLQNEDFLFSYGCGGGSYTSASGIITTNQFATDSLRSVFTILFGSYFGDWDSNNNLLRAALASGTTLTNCWAGRPNWMLHPMALGSHIGLSAQISMDNSSTYSGGSGAHGVHIALMGDPTLRLHSVSPPSDVDLTEMVGNVLIEWKPSNDPVLGYNIYRKSLDEGIYQKINNALISTNNFVDSCHISGDHLEYLVKAVLLESSASGTYYNESQGIGGDILILEDQSVGSYFVYDVDFELLNFDSDEEPNALMYNWDFGDGNSSNEQDPSYAYDSAGVYTVCLTVSSACFSETFCETIEVLSSIPRVEAQINHVICFGEASGSINIDLFDGKPPFEYAWSNGNVTEDVQGLIAGTYNLTIKNGNDVESVFGPYEVEEPDSLYTDLVINNASSGTADGFAAATATGGIPPYTYEWSNGTVGDSLLHVGSGPYTLITIDQNDCRDTIDFFIDEVTNIVPIGDDFVQIYPNPIQSNLYIRNDDKLDLHWSLYTSSGQFFHKQGFSQDKLIKISCTEMNSGLYFVVLRSRNHKQTIPILVQRE